MRVPWKRGYVPKRNKDSICSCKSSAHYLNTFAFGKTELYVYTLLF